MGDTNDKSNALKLLFRFCRENANNDLLNFWLSKHHRCIDKWAHYFPIYEKYFAPFRGTEVYFVEIGVQNGGSIQMWKDYFGSKAHIIGIDIDPRCRQFAEAQIDIEIGSQDSPKFWDQFKQKYPRVDILLDDGGHQMDQQIITFREMFKHISDGGIYMCEDCHTSYFPDYNGGLRKPDTYIEFAKSLIDELNAFHSRGQLNPTYNTLNMGGVHFYDSIVVIEKSSIPFKPFFLRIGEYTIEDWGAGK